MSAAPQDPAQPPPDGDHLDRELMLVAWVVVLGAIMSILDVTVVNVAINTLAAEFDTTLPTIQWVATGYARARDGDPAHGLGRRPLRDEAPLPDLDHALRAGLGAVRARVVIRLDHLLPGAPGLRRRHADAARHDDPHARGGPAARRPRDGGDRGPDAPRPDL